MKTKKTKKITKTIKDKKIEKLLKKIVITKKEGSNGSAMDALMQLRYGENWNKD